MMGELSANDDIPDYSTPALNALHQFHDCSCMIFVEGEDDVMFWETICECADITDARIESVGGRTQLDERIEKITTEGATIIVACDSDYEALLKKIKEHPLIVRTHGYSIENTMYCPSSLNRFLRKLARNRTDYTRAAQEWIDKFCTDSERLLVHDLANERYGKGISVLGNSCARFLLSQRSDALSQTRIETFLNSISEHFSESELQQCEDLIANAPEPLSSLLKGHFLTLGVVNWIKKQVTKRNLSISSDHLYTGTVDSCVRCRQTRCRQRAGMCEAIKRAFEEARVANKTNPVYA